MAARVISAFTRVFDALLPAHDTKGREAMRYEHYDSLELRDPDARERDFFSQLPDFLALAMRAPGWATQLAGIDPEAVTSRAALAKLPLLRKSELLARQKEAPPFGGLNITAPGRLRRLLMSPGPIFEPEGKGKDFWGAARALGSGAALPSSLRQELATHGLAVCQCYATADLGIIAYESEAREGMIINETLLVEIVRPGTGDPAPAGEVGEVVVTSLNPDYPMIRLATGDLSMVMAGRSPCGRTNMRLAGWMGRADQTTKVKGMFVHPGQVADIGKRHPELGRLRLVVARAGEQDVMTLIAECAAPSASLQEAVTATLRAMTKLGGEVKLVAAGSLPNDGKLIADERPVG